jgi:hypothetical protein
MARAGHSGTVVGSAVIVREKYFWPDLQLNIWTIVMLATAGTILGVNAQFMQIQERMGLGVPWYVTFPLLLPKTRNSDTDAFAGSCPTASRSAH